MYFPIFICARQVYGLSSTKRYGFKDCKVKIMNIIRLVWVALVAYFVYNFFGTKYVSLPTQMMLLLNSFRYSDHAHNHPLRDPRIYYTALPTNTLISTKENGKPVRTIPKPLISTQNSQISRR